MQRFLDSGLVGLLAVLMVVFLAVEIFVMRQAYTKYISPPDSEAQVESSIPAPEAPEFEEDTGMEKESKIVWTESSITLSPPVATIEDDDGILRVNLDHNRLKKVLLLVGGKEKLMLFNPQVFPRPSTFINGVPVAVPGITVEGANAEITATDDSLTIRTTKP